jgi:hypothetical protein
VSLAPRHHSKSRYEFHRLIARIKPSLYIHEAAVRNSSGVNRVGIRSCATCVLTNTTGDDVSAGITSLTIDREDMSALSCSFRRLAAGTRKTPAI